jgi:glutamate--cysteine ligase
MNQSVVPNLQTALTGPLLSLEKHLLDRQLAVEGWFRQQWVSTPPPIYASVDIRNACYKVAPIDTNLFPAGFNNLNPDFLPLAIQAMQATITEICPDVTRLLLIPESHTRNLFYFESVAVLQSIIEQAGFECRVGVITEEQHGAKNIELPSGKELKLEPLIRDGNKVGVKDYFPCCIVLNNDLSGGIPEILKDIQQTLMPASRLSWAHRLKSEHFAYYAKVTQEFADEHTLDSWLITPLHDQCPTVDFMKKDGQQCLVTRAESLLKRIQQKYDEYNIKQPPFLVVKADQGTYGMAVMMVQSPNELMELNRKQRTRMSTIKGGSHVTKAIIQEGVPSFETIGDNHAVAEPVVYMIGRYVIGGFYRLHQDRGPTENLNAPGMQFQPMAFGATTTNRFYAYSVIARLALLAAARELAAIKER